MIAHSFGGRVVIKLASEDPHLFGKIVMTGAAGIRPKRTFSYYRRVYTYKLCKRLVKCKPICRLFRVFGLDAEARVQQSGSEEYKVLSPLMRAKFSKVVNEDLTGALPRVKNPTLLLWGTEDADAPLWMGELMERRIPDSGLVKFEGAGHFAYLERCGEFLVIVKHFLEH